MGRWLMVMMLGILPPVSAGGQEARPVEGAAAPTEAAAANQAALTATAAQTARLLHDRDAHAGAVADFDRAQADHQQAMQAFNAQQAAAARRAAEEAAAYRQRLAAWKSGNDKWTAAHRPPKSGPISGAAPPKLHCTMEQPIGSHIPVRVCE